MQSPYDAWFYRPNRNPKPRLRLFCFPYSGATAAMFRLWPTEFAPDIEIVGVELPGRAWRHQEPAFVVAQDAVRELVRAQAALLDVPFAFYGHSLGALLAFETARELRRNGAPSPRALLISGRRAPHHDSQAEFHKLGDEELFAAVAKLGGVPPQVMRLPEMLEALVPVLRADLAMSETYRHVAEPALGIPIWVFGGDNDPLVPLESLDDWRVHTTAGYQSHVFEGGHFFIQASSQPAFMKRLTDAAREVSGP